MTKKRINNLQKEIGRNYIEFMERLFLRFFKNYPYDLEYIKKIETEVEKEKKKRGLIRAKSVDEALTIFAKEKKLQKKKNDK